MRVEARILPEKGGSIDIFSLATRNSPERVSCAQRQFLHAEPSIAPYRTSAAHATLHRNLAANVAVGSMSTEIRCPRSAR